MVDDSKCSVCAKARDQYEALQADFPSLASVPRTVSEEGKKTGLHSAPGGSAPSLSASTRDANVFVDSLDLTTLRQLAKSTLDILRTIYASQTATPATAGASEEATPNSLSPHHGIPNPDFTGFKFGVPASRRESATSISSNLKQTPSKHTGLATKELDSDGTLQLNQYLLLDELGTGSQGTVWLAFDQSQQEFRAIKEMRRPLPTSVEMQQIKAEIAIMKRLRHRNIISLHEVIDDPTCRRLYLVLQHAERGLLVKYTNKEKTACEPIEPSEFVHIARQLTAGLTYLHSHGVLHRDIKPDNILRGRDDQVYLADFGVSQSIMAQENESLEHSMEPSEATTPIVASIPGNDSQERLLTLHVDVHNNDRFNQSGSDVGTPRRRGYVTSRGTPAFFSPEIVAGTPDAEVDGTLVDVWALGVTFYMLLVGKLPWIEKCHISPAASVSTSPNHHACISPVGDAPSTETGSASALPIGILPTPPILGGGNIDWQRFRKAITDVDVEIPSHVPPKLADLLKRMLDKNPESRAPLTEIRTRIKTMKVGDMIAVPPSPSKPPSPQRLRVQVAQAHRLSGVAGVGNMPGVPSPTKGRPGPSRKGSVLLPEFLPDEVLEGVFTSLRDYGDSTHEANSSGTTHPSLSRNTSNQSTSANNSAMMSREPTPKVMGTGQSRKERQALTSFVVVPKVEEKDEGESDVDSTPAPKRKFTRPGGQLGSPCDDVDDDEGEDANGGPRSNDP